MNGMKLLIAFILFAAVGCSAPRGSAKAKRLPPMRVTVDYILHSPDDSSEVWVKRRRLYNYPGYVWYMAKMVVVPDSLYVGKELWLKAEPDSCKSCIVFRYIK